MPYTKQTWSDGQAGGTPLSAARLNNMETGIDQAHDLYDLGVGATGTARVDMSESTTSTTYTVLTTAGPEVAVTVPTSGKVLVIVTAILFNSTTAEAFMSFDTSGANVSSAADGRSVMKLGTTRMRGSAVIVLTGLTPGSTTFTAKYRASSGTATFHTRSLDVIPI